MSVKHDGLGRQPPRTSRRAGHATDLSLEQRGLIVAALAAFFGIAYGGPALTRLLRQPSPHARLARRLGEVRRDAVKARARVEKRVRRLGDTFHG